MNPLNKSHKCPCEKRNNLVSSASILITLLDERSIYDNSTKDIRNAVNQLREDVTKCTKPKIKHLGNNADENINNE